MIEEWVELIVAERSSRKREKLWNSGGKKKRKIIMNRYTRQIAILLVVLTTMLCSTSLYAWSAETPDSTSLYVWSVETPDSTSLGSAVGRKRVGVVLSGGGAKGIAHVGALKVLEEAGIPIDYITGTSMGAIVGALYAIGYSTETLDSLVSEQDWMSLLRDQIPRQNLSFPAKDSKEKYILTVPLTYSKRLQVPSGLVGGHNVYNLLSELMVGYHDSISFKDLPIPFACIAYDLVSGKTIVLDSGKLPMAVRASMSIPGAFAPVKMDDMVLIDGGISNNFPADVLKEMGAEIIIGIDVGATVRKKENIVNVTDMFNQITYYMGESAFKRNKEMVDLYIRPNVKPYTAASFSKDALDTLMHRGEDATRDHWDDLMVLRERIGLSSNYWPEPRENYLTQNQIVLNSIIFKGLVKQKEKNLLKIMALPYNTAIGYPQIQKAIQNLQSIASLSNVRARLENTERGYNLVVTLEERSLNSASIGIRFDNEDKAAILLNATLASRNMSSSHFEITGRLSENPYAFVDYIVKGETKRMLKLSYRYRDNNLRLYSGGKRVAGIDFSTHTVDLSFSNIEVRNFRVGLGVKYTYFDFDQILTIMGYPIQTRALSEGIVNYYATLQYESLDRLYHPRRGISLNAGYMLYTSNFATYKKGAPISAINFNFISAISVSKRVCFLPGVFGRVLVGRDVASFPMVNTLGGAMDGRYLPQQMSFVGIKYFEHVERAVVGVKLDFRVRLWVKNFVSLKMNYAKQDNDFMDILKGKNIYGVGLELSHNSIIGPLSIQFDYSNHTKKLGVYFNIGYYF